MEPSLPVPSSVPTTETAVVVGGGALMMSEDQPNEPNSTQPPKSPSKDRDADMKYCIERLQLLTPPDPAVPRLYYFDARGRAETIRLVLAFREIPYLDLRCRSHPHAMKDFEILKRHRFLPFGQVPLLEIDGLALVQSQAILRYLSRKYNLAGDSESEFVAADMIACAIEDVRQKFVTSIFNWKKPDAEPFVCEFQSETLPQWGKYFESLLVKNSPSEWFVGSRLSYADLAFFDMLSHIRLRIPDAFQDCPGLKAHSERIESIPQIARWLQRRPKTPL